VNKAGTWYLAANGAERQVADGEMAGSGAPGDGTAGREVAAVFRAGRVTSARMLPETFVRPTGFGLAAFRERWSASFVASLRCVEVRLRVSPTAVPMFPQVFSGVARLVLEEATPDERGFREITLTFGHEAAAAQRLAGFGGQVEVLSPVAVRARLAATARELLGHYQEG
jgi:predicted DNA-binding transcriptional regulator YafY